MTSAENWVRKNDGKLYWEYILGRAREIQSDGCTWVAEIYQRACYEHDLHYKFAKNSAGERIGRGWADAVFRERMQQMSLLGEVSPLSRWRWVGVRVLGFGIWNRYRIEERVRRLLGWQETVSLGEQLRGEPSDKRADKD